MRVVWKKEKLNRWDTASYRQVYRASFPLSRCSTNSQSRKAAASVWAGFGTSTSTLLPEMNPRPLPSFPTDSALCRTLCPSREQLELNESGARNASTTDYRAVRSSIATIKKKGMSWDVGYGCIFHTPSGGRILCYSQCSEYSFFKNLLVSRVCNYSNIQAGLDILLP